MTQKKMGRPKSDNPKDYMYRIRMDNETLIKLEAIAKEMNMTKAQVVRKGIEIQYEGLKKK